MYNPHIKDCVFILPKVLIDENEKAFGHIDPTDLIHLDKAESLTEEERRFIYEFAVWIYRALYVFKNSNPDNDIIYHKQMTKVGNHHRHMTNTFLEVLLALVDFNKKNQNFFMMVLRNLHSGNNKINWTKTISSSQAFVQDEEEPIYLDPVNKKRQINFDEELLVIFFSILNYIRGRYGFPVQIQMGYELIQGEQFNRYLNGYGQIRLRQIKYKYFSDKTLYLWELCYAFFERSHQIAITSELQEYLVAKNFNIVFEAIIDELVGDKELPEGLKDQPDGKIVDHLYSYKSLTTTGDENKDVFYIGDSKYYKLGNEIGSESVYKQFTYARNVIQWNMNLFLDGKDNNWSKRVSKYRDEVTEGYNIVPNFFISARMDKELSYDDKIYETQKDNKFFIQRHFENRLFDRDTLLIYHYDVNFLYVVSLYAQNDDGAKQQWKDKVRALFRKEIQQKLQGDFKFYAMTAHPNVDATQYIEENFKEVLGKLYQPFPNKEFFSLALDSNEKYKLENDQLLEELRKHFYVEECRIGTDPTEILEEAKAITPVPVGFEKQKTGVLMVMMENFADKCVKFLPYGKIAIGIKYSKDSMAIVEHLSEIGYILFHTRKDVGQHLFAINGDITVVDTEELGSDVYKNVGTTEMYAVVPFETIELDSSNLHSSKKSFTPKTRYDAQFEELNNLQ